MILHLAIALCVRLQGVLSPLFIDTAHNPFVVFIDNRSLNFPMFITKVAFWWWSAHIH